MTAEQNISFITIMTHLPEPLAIYDESDPMLNDFVCLQYYDYDIRIGSSGDAFLLATGSIKPVLVYDSFKKIFDLSGVPISPIDRILEKVC